MEPQRTARPASLNQRATDAERDVPAKRPRLLTAALVGAVMMGLQPLYLVAEIAVAGKVSAPYSWMNNTISDLGATTCTSIEYPFGPVPVCSPWHPLLNGSFVIFGLLLALGGVLLWRWFGSGVLATLSAVLWAISGLSSAATGLVPLDQNLPLHTLVSLPVFVAQPLAMVVTALAIRARHRSLSLLGLGLGSVSLVAAVVFLSNDTSAEFGGLLERLALWPCFPWLPLLGLAVWKGLRPLRSD